MMMMVLLNVNFVWKILISVTKDEIVVVLIVQQVGPPKVVVLDAKSAWLEKRDKVVNPVYLDNFVEMKTQPIHALIVLLGTLHKSTANHFV